MRAIVAVVLILGALTGCSEWQVDHPAITQTTVDVAQAREHLAGLTVQPAGSMAGYSRDLFPHWSIVSGTCDTRETVLEEQGVGVRTDGECRATSGSWTSPYDGATWSDASDVDIDHMVPLAEAWRSGAAEWDQVTRELFANDLKSRQLIAVTDNINQAKGDQPPHEWVPPLRSYWCDYAINWVDVKTVWQLTVTSAEVTALGDMLDTCAGGA